jgi:hypothetical protein
MLFFSLRRERPPTGKLMLLLLGLELQLPSFVRRANCKYTSATLAPLKASLHEPRIFLSTITSIEGDKATSACDAENNPPK